MKDTESKTNIKINCELRNFGITMACALAIFGGLFLWRAKPVWPYLFLAGGIFLALGLLVPRALAPVEWAWMKFARFLGRVMTTVILTLTFYLMITPIGLLKRLFAGDALKRKFDRKASSYWISSEPDGPASRPEKPF